MKEKSSVRARQWAEACTILATTDESQVAGIVDLLPGLFADSELTEYPWLNRLLLLLPCLPYPNAFRLIERLDVNTRSGQLPNLGLAIVGKEEADHFKARCGQAVMDDYWLVYLSAAFAQWKLVWHQLGCISVQKRGDLRTASLVTNKPKLFSSVLRTKWARARLSHPEIEKAFRWINWQGDRQLSDRIRKAMASPAVDVSEAVPIPKNDWKSFLIDRWATGMPHSAKARHSLPPLAYFSDSGLTDLHAYSDPTGDNIPTLETARKVWERLGLRRSQFAILTSASDEDLSGVLVIRNTDARKRWPAKARARTQGEKPSILIPSLPLPPVKALSF